MKRKGLLKVLSGVVFCAAIFGFTACENFAQGVELQERIEKTIKKEASPFINFSIKNDSNQGAITPAANVYKANYKVTDIENISFTSRDDYQFLYWDASPAGYVKFGNVRAVSTTIEFLEGADTLESLVLMPVCAERPYPTVDPNSTGGDKPKNTSIIINFGKVIQNPVEDLENIDIQIQEENKSIKSHYLKPTFIDERRGIQFIADDTNLIPLDSGTKVVAVIIPGVFYSTEPDGTKVQMAKEVTSSFTIDRTTKSSATVFLEVDSTTGSLERTGNIQFYMGEQFNVIYKMNSGYQFDRWEISSDGGETVEVREGKVFLNGTAVLEELSAADGLEEYYASQNKYQKSYKVLSAVRYLKIKPVSYERLKVKSVLPRNTEAVAKNSPVVITFSKKMDIPEADLKNISIKLGNGLDAKEYFENPLQKTVSDDEGERTQITIKADRNNLIDASQENKNFTVTIPQNFGYTENGVKVTLLSDYSYTYTVNDTTEDKINLSFVSVTGGTLASGSKTLYLDNTYTVSCNPSSEEYEVKGWKVYVRNSENEKDESNPVSEEILGQTVSEDKKSITFKAKNGFTGTVMVKPVCELRKTVSVTPAVNASLGSLKITGKNKLYMGETITLMFTMAEGYQFGGWNVSLDESTPGNLETKNGKVYLNGKAVLEEVSNGEDFDEEYYASRNKYQKIYKTVDSATGIKITPVCYERPVVTSVTPSNTAAVAKNSSIIISFSKGMNITEADLDNISITMDGLSIKEYFAAPVTDSSSGYTNITFAAKRDKLLEITGGTKNITVKIPQSLGYKVNGVNVNLLSDYSYTYSVNNTTEDKINLSFVAVTGGTLASGSKTLYLDNTYTVSCEPSSDAYEVNGWKVYVRNSENEADESSSVSADILGQTVSEDKKSITFEAKSGFTGTVMVKPVCELRKTVSVSPAVNASLGSLKITGKTSLYMDETISLMFTMAEGYQFGGWNVSLDESATGTIETKNGKVYLNGKAVLEEVSNGEDFDEEYYASRNKYQKIYKAVDSASGLKISPVCYEKPVVSSVIPANVNSDGVSFDTDIKIKFDVPEIFMLNTESLYQSIKIFCNESNITGYFDKLYENGTLKITVKESELVGLRNNLFRNDSSPKTLKVNISAENVYYVISSGNGKVCMADDYELTFNVNSNSNRLNSITVNLSEVNGRLNQTGNFDYYIDDSFTLIFNPKDEYAFTGWKITDSSGNDASPAITITEKSKSSDYCEVEIKVSDDTKNLFVSPETSLRPVIVSKTPTQASTGTYRDTKIMVVFDQPMSEDSIYFTAAEQSDLTANGYTLLPAFTDRNGAPHIYGYKDSSGEIFYKNIKISNFKTRDNILSKYAAPYFDTSDVLYIPTAPNEYEEDGVTIKKYNCPEAGSQPYVEISNEMFALINNNKVPLYKSEKWTYRVNANIDNIPPSIAEMKVYASKGLNGARTEVTTAEPSTREQYKAVVTKNKKIELFVKLMDLESGPGETMKLYTQRIKNEKYETVTESESFETIDTILDGDYAYIGSETTGAAPVYTTHSVDLSGKEDGLYKIWVTGEDLNGQGCESNKYYVLLDNTPAEISDFITYTNKDSVEIKWNNISSDIESYTLYRNGEVIAENKAIDASQTQFNAEHAYVRDYDKTDYKVVISDINGNTKDFAVEANYFRPDALVTEVTKATNGFGEYVEFKWTNPDPVIDGCVLYYGTDENNLASYRIAGKELTATKSYCTHSLHYAAGTEFFLKLCPYVNADGENILEGSGDLISKCTTASKPEKPVITAVDSGEVGYPYKSVTISYTPNPDPAGNGVLICFNGKNYRITDKTQNSLKIEGDDAKALAWGGTYTALIYNYSTDGSSGWSAESTPLNAPPATKAENVRATFTGRTTINLEWDLPNSGSPGFNIYYKKTADTDYVHHTTVSYCGSGNPAGKTVSFKNLAPGTEYDFKVVIWTGTNTNEGPASILTVQTLTTQTGTKTKPTAVGDVVFADGSATPMSEIASRISAGTSVLTALEKKEFVAVIVYAGGNSQLGNRVFGVSSTLLTSKYLIPHTSASNTLKYNGCSINPSGASSSNSFVMNCKDSSGNDVTYYLQNALNGNTVRTGLSSDMYISLGTNYDNCVYYYVKKQTDDTKMTYFFPTLAEFYTLRQAYYNNTAIQKAFLTGTSWDSSVMEKTYLTANERAIDSTYPNVAASDGATGYYHYLVEYNPSQNTVTVEQGSTENVKMNGSKYSTTFLTPKGDALLFIEFTE